MIEASQIKDHMEVLSSDGKHVGTVDQMQGTDRIKLTKSDPVAQGDHHLIPLAWVERTDSHVHLTKTAAEVLRSWEHFS